jgi:sulfoxide reductase catalytic subunit YedY
MIAKLNDAQKAVHYPKDRRMFLGIKPYMLIIISFIVIGLIGAAWIQYLWKGLPPDPISQYKINSIDEPSGFPVWIILSHWVNFFFLILIIRSGISILVDHPRLYWNNGCAPKTEWIRFTPLKVPEDKVWTAKEDARYISPLIGLPGYRHTIGIARVWHFLTVPFFVINGAIFISLLFFTNQWKRLVPDSWNIIPRSWNAFVHYATFHLPYEPNGFYHYNPIQQLSY